MLIFRSDYKIRGVTICLPFLYLLQHGTRLVALDNVDPQILIERLSKSIHMTQCHKERGEPMVAQCRTSSSYILSTHLHQTFSRSRC